MKNATINAVSTPATKIFQIGDMTINASAVGNGRTVVKVYTNEGCQPAKIDTVAAEMPKRQNVIIISSDRRNNNYNNENKRYDGRYDVEIGAYIFTDMTYGSKDYRKTYKFATAEEAIRKMTREEVAGNEIINTVEADAAEYAISEDALNAAVEAEIENANKADEVITVEVETPASVAEPTREEADNLKRIQWSYEEIKGYVDEYVAEGMTPEDAEQAVTQELLDGMIQANARGCYVDKISRWYATTIEENTDEVTTVEADAAEYAISEDAFNVTVEAEIALANENHISEQFKAAREFADKLIRVEGLSQEQADAVITATFDGNHDTAAVKKLVDEFKAANFNEAQKFATRLEEVIADEVNADEVITVETPADVAEFDEDAEAEKFLRNTAKTFGEFKDAIYHSHKILVDNLFDIFPFDHDGKTYSIKLFDQAGKLKAEPNKYHLVDTRFDVYVDRADLDFNISYGFTLLARYTTAYQANKAVNMLIDAIARRDGEFTFPTFGETLSSFDPTPENTAEPNGNDAPQGWIVPTEVPARKLSDLEIADLLTDRLYKVTNKGILDGNYLDVTLQNGKKTVTNLRTATVEPNWHGNGFVFIAPWNEVYARYDTAEKTAVVINLIEQALKRGDKEFTYPANEPSEPTPVEIPALTVEVPTPEFAFNVARFNDDFIAQRDELKANVRIAHDALVVAQDNFDDAENALRKFFNKAAYALCEDFQQAQTTLGDKTIEIERQSGSRGIISADTDIYIDIHGGETFAFVDGNDKTIARYDTPAQVKAVINKFTAAIANGDKEFTFPPVEELNA